jgi:hypothetical protein
MGNVNLPTDAFFKRRLGAGASLFRMHIEMACCKQKIIQDESHAHKALAALPRNFLRGNHAGALQSLPVPPP